MEAGRRHGANWPGENEPSRHDVEAANEQPSAAFLAEYKRALLASADRVLTGGSQEQFAVNLSARVCSCESPSSPTIPHL